MKPSAKPDVEPSRIIKRLSRAQLRATTVSDVRAAWGDFAYGCSFTAFQNGRFSFVDPVQWALAGLCAESDERARILICAWSCAERERSLLAAWRKQGHDVTVILDVSIIGGQRDVRASDFEVIGYDAIRLSYWHAKLAVILVGDRGVVIRGSANLNTNQRVEQIDLDCGEQYARAVRDEAVRLSVEFQADRQLAVAAIKAAGVQSEYDKKGEYGFGDW